MTPEERLRATYAAFNARDINEVLAQMAEDVDWPNAWEGGTTPPSSRVCFREQS
jgi:hypothetical protein